MYNSDSLNLQIKGCAYVINVYPVFEILDKSHLVLVCVYGPLSLALMLLMILPSLRSCCVVLANHS